MVLLVRPYLDGEPPALRSPRHLGLLAWMAMMAWDLARLEGEPEAEGLADRMRADLGQRVPIVAEIMDDMLRRARLALVPHAPGAEHVSMVFEGETLTITAIVRVPSTARKTDFH